MFSRAIIFVVLFALGPLTGWGQVKVGTTGALFLSESPSLRAIGMAGAGVALIDDYSYYANPGSLGLFATQRRATANFYPGATDFGSEVDFNHQALILPSIGLGQTNAFRLGIAAYRTTLTMPDLQGTTYNVGYAGRSYEFEDRTDNLVVALGYSGPIEVGAGMTFKLIREEVGDYTASGWGVDLGVLMRYPEGLVLYRGDKSRLSVSPVVGVAVNNLGPSISMIHAAYPLPRSLRLGLAATIAVNNTGRYKQWHVVSVVPAYDFEKRKDEQGFTIYGVEAGLGEAFYVRLGESSDGDLSTYGLTINSKGLAKTVVALLAHDPGAAKKYGLVTERFSVEFSVAKSSYDGLYAPFDRTYHSLSISYGW